jgi:hypothetical protein
MLSARLLGGDDEEAERHAGYILFFDDEVGQAAKLRFEDPGSALSLCDADGQRAASMHGSSDWNIGRLGDTIGRFYIPRAGPDGVR